jgi:Mandelate racemase / muconate lactonizing enzyme, N-terminal domain
MTRRDFAKTALLFAAERYARAARGLPELKIADIRVIPTSAGANYSWVFLKVVTNEPGLYGIGSASNITEAPAIATAMKEQYTPFWIGKNPDRIEDLWQSTNVRTYWRNSTVQNNILSALDMALWDIKASAPECLCTTCWAAKSGMPYPSTRTRTGETQTK